MKRGVTKRQKELLQIIYNSLNSNGYPPSFSEFREQLNIKSNQAIIDHLGSLEKKGVISRGERSARSIKITALGYKILKRNYLLPYLGVSSAGPVLENIEIIGQWQEISNEITRLQDEVFIIRVRGDSMINAGIQEGDQLLVKKAKEFSSGDIVLARTADGTTVKRFISQDAPPYLFLKPENPKYDIIYFTDEVTLQGKIIGKFVLGEIKSLIQGRF